MICPACQSENADAHEVCASCGQALGGLALARGSVVGSRYEILAPLGKGGMGMVFKARDRVLDETVALKVLRADVARSPHMERRFRSEIKLARRVRHRNVCGIHEYGEDGRLRYIAMELIEGTDLKQLLRDHGALPWPQAFEVAIQLAQGLEAIHEAGVVHRDLKTSNVMLDGQGRVRLMDFGIAKQLGSEATLAGSGLANVIGTPEYMSPEQARGEKLDARSDIYGLGIVIYEIFTGSVPFRGDTPIATLFKTLEQSPALEGPAAASLPKALIPVLATALEKEPGRRQGSAREMAEALEAARQASFPAVATPAAPEPATLVERSVTEVSRPAPTPLPPPSSTTARSANANGMSAAAFGSPEASAGPTSVLRPPDSAEESTHVLLRPPAAARGSRGGAASQPFAAVLPRAGRRTVWPWLLGSGALFIIAGAGLVYAMLNLLSARVPAPSVRPAARPIVSARPSPTGPPPADHEEATEARPAVEPSRTPPASEPSPPSIPPSARPRGTPKPGPRLAESRPAASRFQAAPPPASAPPQVAEEPGFLQLRVRPWAAVSVDEAYVGTTPLQPLALAPGIHAVRLTHPDYKPLQRKVTVKSGENVRLEIDLAWEAVPKQP